MSKPCGPDEVIKEGATIQNGFALIPEQNLSTTC
jgi:hypothetical protein